MEIYHHHHHHHHQQQQFEQMSDSHLPPGFRFHPTDEELITYYLLKKVLDSNFTCKAISQVDLNKCEPWDLPADKTKMGEKEWYCFSLRDRKYPTGVRTNRATEAGYWKATGKDREIYNSETSFLLGMKKTLVFYRGRAPKGEKSNWVMHEYRLQPKFAYHFFSTTSKDEWVISRVFQKTCPCAGGSKKRSSVNTYTETEVSSPSPVSLPPLMESPPYATATSACHDTCSFVSAEKEHVPCFSNFYNNPLDLLPPPPLLPPDFTRMEIETSRLTRGLSNAIFPNLKPLQQNLQLPNIFSPVAPPAYQSGSDMNWAAPENEKPGPSELDCIWSF